MATDVDRQRAIVVVLDWTGLDGGDVDLDPNLVDRIADALATERERCAQAALAVGQPPDHPLSDDLAVGFAIGKRAAARAIRGTEVTRRHLKRGTRYVVLGRGHARSDAVDGDEVVAYVGVADGELHVRRTTEFEDGRFE